MATARKSTKSAKKAKTRRPQKTRGPARAKRPATRKAVSTAKPRKKAVKALRYAGVGSDAVLRATGKAWDEWLKVLDRAGAKSMGHKEIALMLSRKFAVPDWWSQMVTVGYEQARGLRKLYQKADGYSATASKTFGAAMDRVYGAWNDPQQRARWLLDAPIEVRRSTDGKSMRITWTAGSSDIEVGFYKSGSSRTRVQLEHRKLPDTAAVLKQKKFWKDALDRLRALLEPVTSTPAT
jgi:uncharacterized protein YndB with AHSA1/START domain